MAQERLGWSFTPELDSFTKRGETVLRLRNSCPELEILHFVAFEMIINDLDDHAAALVPTACCFLVLQIVAVHHLRLQRYR